jgi:hypothetical protein
MTFSPDGRFWWDGQAWRPAISQDGRYRWTGTAWVPVRPVATVLRPTAWTRRLQVAWVAMMVVGAIYFVVLVPVLLSSLNGASMPASDPGLSPAEQERVRQLFHDIVQWTAIVVGAISLPLVVVLLVGTLRRWRWVFWYLLITGLLAGTNLATLPLVALQSANGRTSAAVPFLLPAWVYLAELPVVAAEFALAIWMLVALRRYGTWACVRVPVEPGEPPASGS